MNNLTTVDFHSDTLFAVERDDGVFVAIKPISDTLGLAWNKQLERIKRDTILSEGITVMGIPSVGGVQDTTCLKLDLINGWLFGIDESRVKSEETRQRVLSYKRECYSVLHEHFYGKRRSGQADMEVEFQDTDGAKIRMVTESRQTFGAKAAAQMWFRLGLPVVPAMLPDHGKVDRQTSDAERRILAAGHQGILKGKLKDSLRSMSYQEFQDTLDRLENDGKIIKVHTKTGRPGFRLFHTDKAYPV